jgi:ATP-dependent DNA helicase RecG
MRQLGPDRETNKALLAKHIRDSSSEGAPFAEFAQVLPGLSRRQIQRLMQELKLEGRITLKGSRKGLRWVAV